jgi:hypothetical protein
MLLETDDQAEDACLAEGGLELPYCVRLVDAKRKDEVIAVSETLSVAYVAFYAAIKEFGNSSIILSHLGATIAKWNASI